MNDILNFNAYLEIVKEKKDHLDLVEKKLDDFAFSNARSDEYRALSKSYNESADDYDAACRLLARFIVDHADQIRFE